MADITYRVGLGRPLTYQEADDNFRFVEEKAVESEGFALDAEGFAIAAQNAADSAQSIIDDAVEQYEFAVEDNANRIRNLEYGDGPYPSLDLLFTGARMIDPRIVFERASTGTYFDEMGILRTAGPNEPRIDYDPATGESLGLLVEGAATNLLRWSEAAWSSWYHGGSVYFNEAFDDGSVPWMGDIDVSFFGPQAGEPSFSTSVSYYNAGFLNVGEYWLTGLFKFLNPNGLVDEMTMRSNHRGIGGSSGTAGSNVVRLYGIGGTHGSSSDTGSGIFGESRIVGCRPVGNGWYYYVERFEIVEAGTVQLRLFPYDGISSFTGDGETGLLRTRLQLEKGTHPTSYIPTEASQVTRASDDVIIPTGDWFNPNEGTFVVDFVAPEVSDLNSLIGMGSSVTEEFRLGYGPGPLANFRIVARAGATQTSTPDVVMQPGQRYKAAASYRPTSNGAEWKLVVSGDVIGTAETERLPVGFVENGVAIGMRRPNNNTLNWNGTAASIAYFPRALPDAELQALTQI